MDMTADISSSSSLCAVDGQSASDPKDKSGGTCGNTKGSSYPPADRSADDSHSVIEDKLPFASSGGAPASNDSVEASPPLDSAVDHNSSGSCPPQTDHEPDAEFGHLELESLVAKLSAEEDVVRQDAEDEKIDAGGGGAAQEKGFLTLGHDDAKKWFYRDPQGDIQGER